MADVAVTGGSGLVGGDLVSTLVDAGASVDAIVRSEDAARRVHGLGATPVTVDLFDRRGLRDALWGTDVVFHVAGVNETCVRDSSAMDHVNVDGTRSVVEAAADAGVRRIVHTSSAATIGERQGTIGREHTVHDGEFLSAYARSKTRAEEIAFETAADRDVELVAVNPSSVQGPGRAGGSARLFLYALRAKRPMLFDTHVSLVDIRDCTAGHIAAAERGVAGERYLLSGHTVGVRDAVDLLATVAERRIEPRWIPEGVVRTVGRPLAGLAFGLAPRLGVCSALVDTLLHGHRFDGSRAQRDLGVDYTDLGDTLQATISWFASEGLIPER